MQQSHSLQLEAANQAGLKNPVTTDRVRLEVTNGSSTIVDDLVRLDDDGMDVTPKPSKHLAIDLTGPDAVTGQVIYIREISFLLNFSLCFQVVLFDSDRNASQVFGAFYFQNWLCGSGSH